MGQFPQLWATAWPSQPVVPSHRHRVGMVVPPRAVVTEAFKEGKAAVGLLCGFPFQRVSKGQDWPRRLMALTVIY